MNQNNNGILVLCETVANNKSNQNKIYKSITFELLTEGCRIANLVGQELTAVVITESSIDVSQLYTYGADNVVIVETEKSNFFNIESDAFLVSEAIKRIDPSIVFFGATAYGRVVAPKVAALLKCGITADCTSFEIDEKGKLVQIRPALGGNIKAHIVSPNSIPQMATVRPSVFKKKKVSSKSDGKKEKLYIQIPSDRKTVTKLDSIILENDEDGKIENARVIVSVGQGINKSGFELVEKFAKLVGGVVACSRPMVEAGRMPHSRQVGQSGKTVSPDLYIAIGISGASQHLAGMKTAKKIVAVNIDENAEIFSVADIGFKMDTHYWLKEMIKGYNYFK